MMIMITMKRILSGLRFCASLAALSRLVTESRGFAHRPLGARQASTFARGSITPTYVSCRLRGQTPTTSIPRNSPVLLSVQQSAQPNDEAAGSPAAAAVTQVGGNGGGDASASSPVQAAAALQPEILQPFPEAANPRYMCEGKVGEGSFVVSRENGPTAEELSNENVLRIVRSECTDLEVNTLVWKCLGYRFVDGEWTSSECFPKWRERFPSPPDFIGMQRVYEREVDQPSLRSNQALVRSVPAEHKQSLKTHLKPLGFRGFQYGELTPNKTRRAQCANWLLYYREQLFGMTLEELQARKEARQQQQQVAVDGESSPADQDEWTPPVKEVF